MRTLLIPLLGLLFSTQASATEIGGTLSFEMSNLHNGDSSWQLFSDNPGMPGKGVRGGLRFGEMLSVEAAWQRVRRGSAINIDGGGFQTAWFSDQFTLGPRMTYGIGGVFYPYVGVDGMFLRGVIKIDDDLNSKSNAGQISANGTTLGAAALGGVEFRSPTAAEGLQAAFYLDGGYAVVQAFDFDSLGTVQPGGFIMHGGAGVRF